MNMNWTACAAACVMTLALTGCGGGDGGGDGTNASTNDNSQPSTTTPVAPTENAGASIGKPFLGVWKSTAACSSNWDLVPAADSGRGSFLIDDTTITETTLAFHYSVYSDGQCTKLVGTVTYNYDIVWSASAISGWSKVARVDATFNRYDVSNSSIELDPAVQEAPGNKTKSILAMKYDGKYWLYRAQQDSPKDADGYPTVFKSYPSNYRTNN